MAKQRKTGQVSRLRASWRLARVVLHLFHGLFIIGVQFPRLNEEGRALRVQIWARALLRHLGLRIEVRGDVVSPGPLLLVSNHISWLDIFAISGVCPPPPASGQDEKERICSRRSTEPLAITAHAASAPKAIGA